MAEQGWLFVSKPLVPPFRDGSTVLVRSLVVGLDPRFHVTYFAAHGASLRDPRAGAVVASSAMGYAPGFFAKAKMLTTVMRPRNARLGQHFFFTPNPLTSRVVAGLRRLPGRGPLLQSLMSGQNAANMVPLLRALDRVIVLSEHTKETLVEAGLPEPSVVRIYPGVDEVEPVADPASSKSILYAGDLDEPVAKRLVALANGLAPAFAGGWKLVVACRPKGESDSISRQYLTTQLGNEVSRGHVEVRSEVDDMDALLRSTTLQVFVADHVRKKVDLPLVLLEGLMRGVGLVALDVAPVREIFAVGRRHGLQPGVAVGEDALVSTVVQATQSAQQLRSWGVQARELASREWSSKRMVSAYEELYDGVRRE